MKAKGKGSSPTLIEDWETDIQDIIITDNGIGFNDDNFKSFNTYASDFKKALGCKGVGRMIWLKAFNNVFIRSNYLSDGIIKHREFYFDDKNAVNNVKTELKNDEISTEVHLIDLKEKNRNNTPKKLQTIARDILNHCFLYFVTEQVPKIIVTDLNDTIIINNMYDEIGKDNIMTESFNIDDCTFKLVHYRNYNPNTNRT